MDNVDQQTTTTNSDLLKTDKSNVNTRQYSVVTANHPPLIHRLIHKQRQDSCPNLVLSRSDSSLESEPATNSSPDRSNSTSVKVTIVSVILVTRVGGKWGIEEVNLQVSNLL